MADFCRQCTSYVFIGMEDRNDMKGLTTEEDLANGLYAVVLCEGCGFCQVLPDGSCIGGCYDKEHNYNSPLLPMVISDANIHL